MLELEVSTLLSSHFGDGGYMWIDFGPTLVTISGRAPLRPVKLRKVFWHQTFVASKASPHREELWPGPVCAATLQEPWALLLDLER